MLTRSAAGGLIALALVLAGCGDDEREGSVEIEGGTGTETTGTGTTGTETTGTQATTTPTGEASKTFTVSETEFKLQPASFKLPEAGVVEFVVKNDGGTVHALEVEGPTGEFETEEIQPGESARLKADVGEDGTYELYCPVGNHEQQGMVGELVVGSGGAAGSGDEESSEDKNSGSGGGYGY